MKKNDVFTFAAPNGVEVTAVVIDKVPCTDGVMTDTLYCYSQNRIFTYIETGGLHKYGKVIVDYAILPDYDAMLERYNGIEVAQVPKNMGNLLDFILKEKQIMEELDTSPYVLIDKIIENLKNEEIIQ